MLDMQLTDWPVVPKI